MLAQIQITEDTVLAPGRYSRTDSGPLLEIASSGVSVDLGGAVLDGGDFSGVGVLVRDCSDVTIRNGVIRGFYQGIRAERVRRLRLVSCVVSYNHNPADIGWLPDTHQPNEGGFGGGIYLHGAAASVIAGCEAKSNFNGIDLVSCQRVSVRNSDFSDCSNIGIHLLRSGGCVIERNEAERCVRYTGRFPNDTADSAGVLLEEWSHGNRIVGNSLRHSGDGLFIRANNRHGSNENYIARNDGSFSPNNAFEADFSKSNVFEGNIADHSNYGFWLGYSRDTVVRGNLIRSNRLDGIAIEHGSGNAIVGNQIVGNRNGIRLWWEPSELGDDPSSDYTITGNRIWGSLEYAVSLTDTTRVGIDDNRLGDNAADIMREWIHVRPPG